MRDNRDSGAKTLIKPAVWGIALGMVVTFLFLLLLAFFLTLHDFPASAAVPLVSIAAGVGALVGGFVAAKIHGSNGAFLGAVTGLALFVIVLIASMFSGSGGFTVFTLLKLIIMLLSASIGGIFAMNVGQKRKLRSV
jgi:putative membrane protein (TIGR04086 family)